MLVTSSKRLHDLFLGLRLYPPGRLTLEVRLNFVAHFFNIAVGDAQRSRKFRINFGQSRRLDPIESYFKCSRFSRRPPYHDSPPER